VGYEELNGHYRRLRNELDAAYAVPVWNTSRIDRITEQILEVERAIAAAERGNARSGPLDAQGSPASDALSTSTPA
jgi:hypothetical protein